MVIAFDHPNLEHYLQNASNKQEIDDFITNCYRVEQNTLYEKQGIFTGEYITNPFTDEKVPLYISNFVLAEYGTGAVMSVPSHDQRDFEFAKKYNLPIKVVIENKENDSHRHQKPADFNSARVDSIPYVIPTGKLINSGEFNGMTVKEAQGAISVYSETNRIGKRQVNYKLKDWLISRQRYWGNPIPIVYDEKDHCICLNESDLPVVLPEDVSFAADDTNPLLSREDYLKQDLGGQSVSRDMDTMDTFTCSSWYFLRYLDPHNKTEPFSKAAFDYWGNVDFYVGGVEHACLHLLYARFFFKVARDLKLVTGDEPFTTLLTQGMVTNKTYYEKDADGKYHYYFPNEVEVSFDEATKKETAILKKSKRSVSVGRLEKMSKSKKNGVSPDDIITRYGADAVRLFILFAAPPEKDLEWNEKGVEGCHRFLTRVWRWMERLRHDELILSQIKKSSPDEQHQANIHALSADFMTIRTKWHKTIKKVTDALEERYQFNTAIASLMEFLNAIIQLSPAHPIEALLLLEIANNFLILLSPFAPFIVEELAERMQFVDKNDYLCQASWPIYDEAYLKEEFFELVVQINGKLRAKITIEENASKQLVVSEAHKNITIQNYLDGKKIIKEIYVPNKLLNLVVKN